jgi:hypothetical protein
MSGMDAVPHALDEDLMFAPYTTTALPRTLSPARERGPKAEANWLDSSLDLQRGLTVQELPWTGTTRPGRSGGCRPWTAPAEPSRRRGGAQAAGRGRAPKMAVPMRTIVAPSSTAASRSALMPIDSVSRARPWA